MRRRFFLGLLAAACAALALAVPAAGAGKPSVSITKFEAFGDGLTYHAESEAWDCAFHTTLTYTVNGKKYASGLSARSTFFVTSVDYVDQIYESLGTTPFDSSTLWVGPASPWLTAPSADYSFFGEITDKTGKVVTSKWTPQFTLSKATYVNGCPTGLLSSSTWPY